MSRVDLEVLCDAVWFSQGGFLMGRTWERFRVCCGGFDVNFQSEDEFAWGFILYHGYPWVLCIDVAEGEREGGGSDSMSSFV